MRATLTYNQKTIDIQLNKSTITDDLYVIFTEEISEQAPQYKRLKLAIHPKTDVVLQDLTLQIPTKLLKTDRVFCNGFQSWSESRLFNFDEKPDTLRSIAKPLMGYYGDYHMGFVPTKKGVLHSWTYAYHIAQAQQLPQAQTVNSITKTENTLTTTENATQCINFIGSLDESSAFTCLMYDLDNQQIIVKKDLAGLQLNHSFPVLDLLLMNGDTPSVFDHYFSLQDLPKRDKPVETGWTSWYNYYNKISETIIDENLNAFAKRDIPIDYFQIDDGWQTRIGDWLSVKPSFPNGMKVVADKIHQKGFKAGLWLSPFIVESKSCLFQEKPEWILRGPNGKPVVVGYSPYWSGRFYALDFYHPDVQKYLTGIFHAILNVWGFDMVKLDFLYAVAVLPRPNKTRGQVMSEAMQFLRRLVGDKILLACGVPLGSAFGLVDYCRVGADIHLSWEHKLLKFLKNRERVSTIVALRTVLSRWPLNGRAFQNDSDVFILREKNNQLTDNQRDTVMIINALLGNLLFTSDNLNEYTEGVLQKFNSLFRLKNRHVLAVIDIGGDFYNISFTVDSRLYVAYSNLSKQFKHINHLVIAPFETLIVDSKSGERIVF
jgi:alpha-galactosidase